MIYLHQHCSGLDTRGGHVFHGHSSPLNQDLLHFTALALSIEKGPLFTIQMQLAPSSAHCHSTRAAKQRLLKTSAHDFAIVIRSRYSTRIQRQVQPLLLILP